MFTWLLQTFIRNTTLLYNTRNKYKNIQQIINPKRNNKNIACGVSIFVDNPYNYNIIDSLCTSIDGFIDIVTVNITITNKNIMVRGIYKSHQANIINFSDFIYCNFNIFSSKYTLFLVCDFNINLLEKKIKWFLLYWHYL